MSDDDTTRNPDDGEQQHRRSPALIATAIALPVALVAGIIVAAVLATRQPATQPVALSPVPAPHAQSQSCRDLIGALPADLGDYHRAQIAQPAPAGAAAWQSGDSDQPVTLRCGLNRPPEFVQGAGIQVVDSVQWFKVSGQAQHIPATTWYAVDRGVYLALTLPDGSGPTPIQVISDVVRKTIPAQPIDPAPAPQHP